MARKPEKAQRTYQARLADPDGSLDAVLGAYANLYGQAERALFADLAAGCEPDALKSSYLIRFGLTARQFNAIAINLKGKIASIKERRSGLIDEAKARIKKAEQVITQLEKRIAKSLQPDQRRRLSAKRHQKQRRLATLQDRLARLEADHANGTVRLCFGGRKRFHAQFNLEANGYDSHAEWREDWQRARASQFYVIGSKGETAGCQGCVITPLGEQRFALRLRLPHAQCQDGETYRRLELELAYGAEAIHAALKAKQAISDRFVRDRNGWRVFLTTVAKPVQPQSSPRLGAIGIDLNADHLALCETDRFGNPIASATVALCTDGLDRHQTQARIGEAIKAVMAFAHGKDKPLAIEQLDFAKKKAALEDEHPRYARMLSALAYTQIIATLKARAHDAGLEVITRNPAYTSVIGRAKFAERYGLGAHHAAALVIARRALNLSERPNRRARTARALPVRNRARHVWSFWSQVVREERRMQRAGGRSSDRSRSPPTPRATASPAIHSPVVGAIPAREA